MRNESRRGWASPLGHLGGRFIISIQTARSLQAMSQTLEAIYPVGRGPGSGNGGGGMGPPRKS